MATSWSHQFLPVEGCQILFPVLLHDAVPDELRVHFPDGRAAPVLPMQPDDEGDASCLAEVH